MKKITLALIVLCFSVSMASAQLLIGAKAGGMGGAGVANALDLAAAYYNPAALMRSGVKAARIKGSLGAAYGDPSTLLSALSGASNPAQFIIDNYSNNLNFDGTLDGVIGINIKKIGLSIVPVGSVKLAKNADTISGATTAEGQYATTITLGTTLSMPFLPAALDVGVNIKSISAFRGSIVTTGTATSASGTRSYRTGSGMGFDVGALTTFDVPMVSSLKAGLAVRNVGQSIRYSRKSQVSYLDYLSGTVTTETEQTLTDLTATANRTVAVGASAIVPGINLLLASDLEFTVSGTNAHLGIEYPLFANAILLRGGLASGNSLSKTTLGLKLNLPIFTLDAVTISDANNPGLTSYIFDIKMGL